MYGIASSHRPLGKTYRIAGPGCGFRRRVVSAQDLRSTAQRGVALGSLVGTCLYGLLVRPGTDQITLLNQTRDDFGGPFVLFDECAIWLAGLRVGKDDSSAQRRVPL